MLGRNLGNYHVVSKIGEGGMGAVDLARHVTLGRPAAIKVLHPSLSSNQDMVSRFFNEARAATVPRRVQGLTAGRLRIMITAYPGTTVERCRSAIASPHSAS